MIKMSEYAKRRRACMQQIGPNGLMIIPAAEEKLRNGDATYAFRQHSDFYYLTGFTEPDAILVLAPKRKQGEFILFNRIRDEKHEVWDGPRAGQQGACRDFHADQAYPINEFAARLPALLKGRKTIHYPTKQSSALLKTIKRSSQKMALIDSHHILSELRLIKSSAEIKLMKQAATITAAAHIRAMRACRPGIMEYALEADILHEFIRQAARAPAYITIVGSGSNSCILHYISNNQKIKNGDLVLIDAGAEYQHYAADVTRTFPANGRFSNEQREIYSIVLAAQLAAIKSIRPGASWDTAQQITVKIITQGLIDLGILKGDCIELIEKRAYLPFYMHRSGHWLGLDVHDVGAYRIKNDKWRTLKPGMVLTVEPGIYISSAHKNVHKRWHNIGVRIEDDVLVTSTGHEVLSSKAPKSIADIEKIMAS